MCVLRPLYIQYCEIGVCVLKPILRGYKLVACEIGRPLAYHNIVPLLLRKQNCIFPIVLDRLNPIVSVLWQRQTLVRPILWDRLTPIVSLL